MACLRAFAKGSRAAAAPCGGPTSGVAARIPRSHLAARKRALFIACIIKLEPHSALTVAEDSELWLWLGSVHGQRQYAFALVNIRSYLDTSRRLFISRGSHIVLVVAASSVRTFLRWR